MYNQVKSMVFPWLNCFEIDSQTFAKNFIMHSLKFSKFNLISTKTDVYFWRTNLFTRN